MFLSAGKAHRHPHAESCTTIESLVEVKSKVDVQIVEKDLDTPEVQCAHDLYERLEFHGLALKDAGQICWADDSKFHPRVWSIYRKLFNTLFVILYEAFA